ncbi:MAG: cobyrinate a,c-diamide synthase [Alphaproteobacteria bacterium]|mgnify:CR=1 FL=1
MTSAFVIGAPASGSGKTAITLALLRLLKRRGVAVSSCKVGPDYIDPAFHAAASGRPCLNLDGWAMRPDTLHGAFGDASRDSDLVVIEGVMGLFDGAPLGQRRSGTASTADLAAHFGWPIILVVDVEGQGASAAATIEGFARYREDVRIAGVILNKVGGPGHEALLRDAIASCCPAPPVLGAVFRHRDLALPERHLGLVQASEHAALEAFLERAADHLARTVDIERILGIAASIEPHRIDSRPPLTPIGQHIAIASDVAFSFVYPLTIAGWRGAGAEVSFFSPLADEPPPSSADAIFLPGGYPELHAGQLAASARFLGGLKEAADRGASIVGECGGYMVLGRGLIDGQGVRHAMAGLLPVETSFAEPRLHLGYRRLRLMAAGPLGQAGQQFRGHEFHYAAAKPAEPDRRLFEAWDAKGAALAPMGSAQGRVVGSFAHLIDRADS